LSEREGVLLAEGAAIRPPGSHDETPLAAERPLITVEDTLSFAAANALSARRGARLVLAMGEPGTGRTALWTMLWQQFIEQDGLDGHRFAGTRTARGFERRAYGARVASRGGGAHFAPTRPAADMLLHLRVRTPDARLVELLLADIPGLPFEAVRRGRPLREEVPWAGRAARYLAVIDGEAMGIPGESEIAITRARRLLLSLQAAEVVRETARVAVVVTKSDRLGPLGEAVLARHQADLVEVAQACDPDAVLVRTAAIAPPGVAREGLGELVAWLCEENRPPEPRPVATVEATRAVAAFRA
jgi:hypothetical protein